MLVEVFFFICPGGKLVFKNYISSQTLCRTTWTGLFSGQRRLAHQAKFELLAHNVSELLHELPFFTEFAKYIIYDS